MTVPYLFRRETHWVCPNCTLTDVTFDARPHSRFHDCAGLRGISAPMVEDGIDCKVEANLRDDYIGDEIVTVDGEGRPVMNVTTTRPDGTDLAVFAPCAAADLHIG